MVVFRTNDGPVRGRGVADDVVAVLGIPYAAPPFGAARFREPLPVEPWTEVRDCTRFGPVAPQSAELPGAPSWSPGDEDVLTLNVWAPAGATSLPVLVWIHGGAYTFGSSAQPDFDGTALARDGGLIVVTINYRVGFEGFGHVPADGDGTLHPDNRGLLDQVAALRWVRENIGAFGGDPENVTAAGQSAGATSVAALMVMDRARGLFRRAIAHSAVGPCWSAGLAREITARVAAAAGVPATAAALAATPPETLVAASDTVADDYRRDPASGHLHYDPVLYAPVADGDILPADPLAAVTAGAGREVDLLVCHTTQEYWLMDAVGSSAKITTWDGLKRFAADFGLPDDLPDRYRALLPDDAPVLDVYLSVFGDLLFAEYSSRLGEAHARAGGRAFMSRFDRRSPGTEEGVRAWHCADVPLAFGNHGLAPVEFLLGGPPSPADDHLSRRMLAAWAEFASTGDPGWQSLDSSGSGPARIWAPDDGEARTPLPDTRPLWGDFEYRPLEP
ncbi:carboxylesterase family protein [Streptomyces sp. Tu 2975]|uniref:carboxylesterase/lipase family protein n=1 Tax=Streptomyces sp. Tu 2975 TaxID=2676871 RepID=UPI0013595CE9|nr:carboxylesterase family protein [Streptomyces sp. Tu 2975]QIP83886.1 carboxylesterase family protein [Streptomyces sp. Tu 2975]